LLCRDAEAATVGVALLEQMARTKTAMGHRWDAVADRRHRPCLFLFAKKVIPDVLIKTAGAKLGYPRRFANRRR
jgi:hypothetical protein